MVTIATKYVLTFQKARGKDFESFQYKEMIKFEEINMFNLT
jgi:hypothetical protein